MAAETPWWMQLILALLGSAPIAGGIGWLVRNWREASIARERAYLEKIDALQKEVKDLLQDRIKYEMVRRESSDQTMAVLNKILAQHGNDSTERVLGEILAIIKSQREARPT